MTTSMPGPRWRIGELAAATGLTARTLRHYEAIGLLRSPSRTEGGHRLYTEDDVQRLYAVVVLRDLGLPLSEIGEILDSKALPEVLTDHLASVEEEVVRLAGVRDRLRRLTAYVDEPVSATQLVDLIAALTRLDRELAPELADQLAARRAALGPAGARSREQQWRKLGTDLRHACRQGATPGDPALQPLLARARRQLEEFTGGDPAIWGALQRLRDEIPDEGLAGWDRELITFLHEALAADSP